MTYYIELKQNNTKQYFAFTKTNDDFSYKSINQLAENTTHDYQKIRIDCAAILNKNWYTFLDNTFNFDINLFAPLENNSSIDYSYLTYASVLLAIKNTGDTLLIAEFFNRNHSIFLCNPLCTRKIVENLAVEALFGWLYGRFCDSSLFESFYYNQKLSDNQQKAILSDTSVFLYKAAFNNLRPCPQKETPEQMFIRYFKTHKISKFSVGIVGSNYANWISSGLDYIEKTIKQKSATDFIAHKTRIQNARNDFFAKTNATLLAEPYNEHDSNAIALYLDDIESLVTGNNGMCLAGFLRKTGAKILRESMPNQFVFNSKLVRIGNTQTGKSGLVVELCV